MTDKTNTMKLIIRGILAMLIAAPALVSAQDRYGETEEQQILCKEAISVYVSYKKQKNYDEAYIQWKKACDVCPPTAREGMYSDGVRFLKNELKKTEDEARTQALQDSIFLLYDQRMELFPSTSKKPNNRCRILAYKATDYYRLFKKDGAAVANAMFKESIDCLGAASSPATLSTYYVTSFYAMKRMEDDAEAKAKLGEMLTEYLTLMDYLDQGIATATAAGKADAVEDYTKAKGNLDEVFIAIAQCEDMVPVLSEKVAADSANFELKQKVLRLLNQKDCTDNDLYLPVAIDVHNETPSHPSAYAIGNEQAKVENFGEAFAYMEEAVALCADCAELEVYLLKAGKIASFLGKSSTARSYAQKVLANNPESGEAYMLIGDAIAGAAKQCDDGALGSRLAYLRACDYYGMAISRGDEDIKATAKKKLNANSKQFPSVDEIFAVGKSTGDAITIPSIGGCPCAGESTTIRVR